MLNLLLLCVTSFDCYTSYTVSTNQGKADYTYNDLGTEFHEKEAYIMLKDGSEFRGSEIRVKADSLFWIEPASKKHNAVAINEVLRISRTNHLIGALEGLGFGLVGSALVISTDPPIGIDSGYFIYVLIGVLAPPPLGLIVGMIVGHSYEYNFSRDSTNTNK